MTGNKPRILFLLFLFFFLPWQGASSQIELKLQLQPDGQTYTVYARPGPGWVQSNANLVDAAQITLVVPAGSFDLDTLENHLGFWQLTHLIAHPAENPGSDYVVFNLVGTIANLALQPGVPSPLFSFNNAKGCVGPFEIIDHLTDPFMPPNSLGANVGNVFFFYGNAVNAYEGNFDTGSADCNNYYNCRLTFQIVLLPDNYYQVSVIPHETFMPHHNVVELVQVTVKVPTGGFQVYDLTNLMQDVSFEHSARYNAPPEAPQFDYLVFHLASALSTSIPLEKGMEVPLFKFANGGSCQGSAVALMDNQSDAFYPPNSLLAKVGQFWKFGSPGFENIDVCIDSSGAAPCAGCLFTAGQIAIDSIRFADPSSCLGGNDGMIEIFASGGASALAYSLDGGATWSASHHFGNLPPGDYHPVARGDYSGCEVEAASVPVNLKMGTTLSLVLNAPAKVCAGEAFYMGILAPDPLPPTASYLWTGPLGFSASIPDPVFFNANTFQSGTYTLTLNVPGCDQAVASAFVQVVQPEPAPALLTNAPLCQGDTLVFTTYTPGTKYEWIGPAGQSAGVLAMPGLTTTTNSTSLPAGHLAYLPGEWRVRVTDLNGCQVESPPIEVSVKPRPQAFATNDGPVCPGGSVQLLSNPLAGATYRWREAGSGNLFSMLPNPVVQALFSPRTFELEIVLDGCVSENTALTTAVPYPLPTLDPSASYTVAADCTPGNLKLLANAGGTGLSYTWTGPKGFVSHLQNPTIPNVDAAYNGSYLLTVTNVFGCSAQKTVEVTNIVNQVPQPLLQSTGPACTGSQILLSTQQYSGSFVSYQWLKNGAVIPGATSYQLFLSNVKPSDEGYYKVRVQVDACTLTSAELLVKILESPVVTIDFSLSQACEGGTLQFFGYVNNAGPNPSYLWTGPSGFTSNALNPLIYQTQFETMGAYTLTVTATNGCKVSQSIVVDGILDVPNAPTVTSNSPVCEENDIILTIQNPPFNGTVSFEWFNGAGEPLFQDVVVLTIPANDPLAIPPFLVRTVVNGCPSPFSDAIPVLIKAAPAATASNSGPVCPGESVQLFAGFVPDALYEWRIAGSAEVISVAQSPVLPNIPSTTTFQLTVKIPGCNATGSAITTVQTKPAPVAANLSGGGIHCEGTAVTLSATNSAALTGILSYTWSGPNGFSFSGTGNAGGIFPVSLGVPNPQQEGTYTLVLSSPDGCQSQPASVVLDIVPSPATPSLSVSANQLCQDETIQLNSNTYSGNVVFYNWFFQNGPTPILLATTSFPTYFLPAAAPSNSGNYFLVVNVNGCVSDPSNLQNVNVLGTGTNIAATNTTSDTAPVCAGAQVQLSATIIPGAAYQWYGPLGFHSTLPNPVLNGVLPNQSGNYLVAVSLPGCSTVVTASTTVYVQAAPPTPLLAGKPAVCAGGDAVLTVINPAPAATYHFYFENSSQLLVADAPPALTLSGISPAQAGVYFAVANVNGCASTLSAGFLLSVDVPPGNAADGGADQLLCKTLGETTLQATPPSAGTGKWTSPTGAAIVNPDQAITLVKGLKDGTNLFVWTLSMGACLSYSADTVVVNLTSVPAEEAFAGIDQSLCALSNATLKAQVPMLSNGAWSQTATQAAAGVVIDEPYSPTTTVKGLKPGQSYAFTWSLSFGNCQNFSTDEVLISLEQMPGNQAFISQKELSICDGSPVILKANPPLQGSGQWSSGGGAFIIEPSSPVTFAEHLQPGKNLFIWSLSTPACPNYSSDTLTVWREWVEALPDSFTVPFNGVLGTIDLLENDVVHLASNWEFFLLKKPLKGEVLEVGEGIVSYRAYPNAFGGDELVYILCPAACPQACDTAHVRFFIEGKPAGTPGCFVPNLVTPNADHENDAFVVPCAAEFAGSSLVIFNRWGAKIFETDNYQNNWDGTYGGDPVPVGTYFYRMILNDGNRTALTGFVVVMR